MTQTKWPEAPMPAPIAFLGDAGRAGVYVLWLRVSSRLSVTFGRYQGGRPIEVLPGELAYAGSALGGGATSLANRLLRHATRTAGKPPHAIRDRLLAECVWAGLVAPERRPPAAKQLRWHIDYLLDEAEVEIAGITAARTTERLESPLARRLAALPGVVPLAPGLGAGDAPGESHLLRYTDSTTPTRLAAIIAELIGPT